MKVYCNKHYQAYEQQEGCLYCLPIYPIVTDVLKADMEMIYHFKRGFQGLLNHNNCPLNFNGIIADTTIAPPSAKECLGKYLRLILETTEVICITNYKDLIGWSLDNKSLVKEDFFCGVYRNLIFHAEQSKSIPNAYQWTLIKAK